jgi:purine-binding chemotaxis protein CheW
MAAETEATEKHSPSQERQGKYLTFALEKEEYGISILKVREIIGILPITTVPQTPPFVKGVINLRGKVIPIVDLRAKFGMAHIDYTEKTSIIVVDISGVSGKIQIGVVVDHVSEVVNIRSEDIEDTPTFGTAVDTEFILGIAKIGKGIKILLDIDKVLRSGEMSLLEDMNN